MTHVLIVEDHAENRNLLKLLLEVNGYRVTAAGDGLEALAAARRDPPDAVVSDALMPKMDGFALCRAWMQDAALKAIPFIFYSATYVRPDDEQFTAALGAVRYLIKPLEAKVFLAELDAVLQKWAGRDLGVRARPRQRLRCPGDRRLPAIVPRQGLHHSGLVQARVRTRGIARGISIA